MNAIPVQSFGSKNGSSPGVSLLLFASGWLLLALVALPLPSAVF